MQRDHSLRLVIPDRGGRQAAVLCCAASAADYFPGGRSTGGNRGGATEQLMKTETFAGKTLDEAINKLAQWQVAHKGAIIKKQHSPVTVKMRAGEVPYAPKSEGKPSSVYIKIDYEDSN